MRASIPSVSNVVGLGIEKRHVLMSSKVPRLKILKERKLIPIVLRNKMCRRRRLKLSSTAISLMGMDSGWWSQGRRKLRNPGWPGMGKDLLPQEGCWRPETEGTASIKLVCILTARKQGWLRRLQCLLKNGRVLEGGKSSKVIKLLGRAIEMLVQEEIRQSLRSLRLGLVVGLGQNLRKGKLAQQHLIRGLAL